MRYRYIDDTAIADIAFEAYGKTMEELFESCALAVTNIMIEDVNEISPCIKKNIDLTSDECDILLFGFLQEIIFYKDAEQLMFSRYDIDIDKNHKWRIHGIISGEKYSQEKHRMLLDVKAITLHKLSVKFSEGIWIARVVVDI